MSAFGQKRSFELPGSGHLKTSTLEKQTPPKRGLCVGGSQKPGVSVSLRELRLLECDCAVYQRVHRKQRQQCAACEPPKRPPLPSMLRQARQQSNHPAEKAERSTNAGNHCPLLTYRHGTPPWILLPSVIRNCEEDLVANGDPVCAPSLAGSREGPPRVSPGNDRSGWRVQPVDATLPLARARAMKPNVFRRF